MKSLESFAEKKKWKIVANLYRRAASLGPFQLIHIHRINLVRLKLDQANVYAGHCQRLLASIKQSGGQVSPAQANFFAWLCCIGPANKEDAAYAAKLIEAALATLPKSAKQARYSYLNTWGATLYRAGQYKAAIQRLNEGIELHGAQGGPMDWLFLAMAHQQLKDTKSARMWLDKVTASKAHPTIIWDRLEFDLIEAEARKSK